MKTMIRTVNWVAFLCLATLMTGCGGGGESDSVSREQQSDQELPSSQHHHNEQYQVVSTDEDDQSRENPGSGIMQTAGSEEPTGSGIQLAAGEENLFDNATINGIPVFDDDDAEADAPEEKIVPPKPGTPEFHISEITKLRLARPPQTKDIEQLRKWQHDRNLKIIGLAEKAVAATHNDPKQIRIFDVAINKLLETRLQLAVDGDKESVDALYEHAASLHKRDPESAAAAEGAFTLVQLAFSNSTAAIMSGSAAKDPAWLQEFARQAEAYALKFPKDEKRSIPLFFTAAETCELNGLTEEAVRAYSIIAQRFDKHPAAEVSVTILRRLKMRGKRIKLFGTSLENQKVSLEQFSGKPIVVFFWSTEAQPSVKQIPEVVEAVKKHGSRLGVIGVCVDSKRESIDAFLEKQKLPWPNIFHADEEKRGWNNPIVKFYGVRRIPAIWVLDSAGRVVTTSVAAGQLEATLAKLGPQRTAAQPRSTRKQ